METKDKKFKLNKKALCALCAVLILVVLIIFLIKGCTSSKNDYKDRASYTESFFIKNKKGKYALFNESGKQLSKFIYESASKFNNHSALVSYEAGEYAILNEKGKEIVKKGKYNYISDYRGLYKARKDDGYDVLTSKGKVLASGKDIDLDSYGDDYPIIIVDDKKTYTVYNYNGDKIIDFKYNKKAKEPTVSRLDEYATVYYNGKTVLFNVKKADTIATINKKQHYCVNNVTEDGKTFTLNACASWFETVKKDGQIIVTKGNIVDLSDKCTGFNIYNDNVVCTTKDGAYFVELKGKKTKLGNKIAGGTAFINDETYAERSSDYTKVNFFVNGKKKQSVVGTIGVTGYVTEELYLITTKDGVKYYDKKGNLAFKGSFKRATLFDDNKVAIVSKDGSKYYLINTKGKKVSKSYSSIYSYGKYYEVTNKNGKHGVINSDGKVVIDVKYESISVRERYDVAYATARLNGKYTAFNLDSNKELLTSKDQISFEEHYIKVSGNKTKYNTYKGKEFLSL